MAGIGRLDWQWRRLGRFGSGVFGQMGDCLSIWIWCA